MQLLADGIPPSLLCDLADPEAMIADLQAELAELEATRDLQELHELQLLAALPSRNQIGRHSA